MNKKRLMVAILGGFFVKEIFRLTFSLALEQGYGIDTNVYFLGRVVFNIFIIAGIVIASSSAGIFIGIVTRKKGALWGGVATLVPYFLMAICILAYSTIGRGLTEHGQIWLKNTLIDGSIWMGIDLIFCMVGGYIGEKIYNTEKEIKELSGAEGVVSYFFAPKLRLFFTIPFISFVVFYLFVFQLHHFWLMLKWLVIGSWYIILSPSLWLWGFVMQFFIFFLELTYVLPIFSLFMFYKIMHSSSRKIAKVFLVTGLTVAVLVGSSLAGSLGYFPIMSIVSTVTYRGGQIWEILLDEYTYPLAHANLWEYYKDKDTKRALIDKNKAKKGFIAYADSLYLKGLYQEAIDSYALARNFSEDDALITYKEGLCYLKGFQEEKAIDAFLLILQKYPDDIAVNCNIALAYTVTNNASSIMQWERCLEIIRNATQDFQMKEDFIGWILNYIESPEAYYPSFQMQEYILKLDPIFE